MRKVFAKEITKNVKYKGKYLIFIEYINDEIKLGKRSTLFKIKITKECRIPTTIEEINSLDYIKMYYTPYSLRVFPCDYNITYEQAVLNYKDKTLPDQYNYLYTYITEFQVSKKDLKEKFIYLGEFEKFDIPENEYIPHTIAGRMKFINLTNYEELVLKGYEDFNLKKGWCYEKENIKIIEENAEIEVKGQDIILKEMQTNEYLGNAYITGWGVGLYDCDTTCDILEEYKNAFSKYNDITKARKYLYAQCKDYIKNMFDCPLFFMVMAEEDMKNKILTKEIKEIALESIEIDLDYWKKDERYKQRKKELDKLKKKLEEYQCEN